MTNPDPNECETNADTESFEAFPRAGTNLGPYQNLRPLGAGGMARVFLADDVKMRRQVALKVLGRHLAMEPDKVQRFEREIDLLANLKASHVVRVFDRAQDGDYYWYAMELVQGRSLAQAIKDDDLTLETCLRILALISDALSQVHKAGIAHRDIKPHNVVLDDSNRPTLIDFGVAKGFAVADMQLTMDDQRSGTPFYMSPDDPRQLTHNPEVAKQSDIWAFGVMAYEVLARGTLPWNLRYLSIPEVLHVTGQEPPEPLQPLAPDVPEELADLVMQCMESDHASRPTAQELALAFHQEVASQYSLPAKSGEADKRSHHSWRTTGLVAGLVALLIAIAVLSWMILAGGQQQPDPPLAAAAEPPETPALASSFTPAGETPPEATTLPADQIPDEQDNQTDRSADLEAQPDEAIAPAAQPDEAIAPAAPPDEAIAPSVVDPTPRLWQDAAPDQLKQRWQETKAEVRHSVYDQELGILLYQIPRNCEVTIEQAGVLLLQTGNPGQMEAGAFKIQPGQELTVRWYSAETHKETTLQWQPRAGAVDCLF